MILRLIEIIGMKKLIILAAVAGVNVVMALFLYLFFMPQRQTLQGDLARIQGQITSRQAEITKLQEEYDTFLRREQVYQGLGERGFIGTQNRIDARNLIEKLQKAADLLQVSYQIAPALYQQHRFASESGYMIITSTVTMQVQAMDDRDFFKFIYLVENNFPGSVSIKSVELKRVKDLTDTILRQVINGQPTVMVNGTFSFDWQTILPQEEAEKLMQGALK